MALLVMCGVLVAQPAYAYIDPASQNLLIQTLSPILLVAATAFTFLRKQIRAGMGWVANMLRNGAENRSE